MKFNVNSYHFKLLRDYERLSAFKEAIDDYAKDGEFKDCDSSGNSKVAFDLGCGSGVLSYLAKDYFDRIIAIELNNSTYRLAKENLKDFDNIQVFNDDILSFDFDSLDEKADLIICEMLDTALIDEEEIPVLEYAKNFLKDDGKIIPESIINTVELVNLERHYLHWDEGVNYDVLSEPMVYSEFNFLDDITPEFEADLSLNANKDGIINGLKITTYTKLNENLIVGPLPMLNPPLLIPLNEKSVKVNDLINVKLKYIMGNGIESIEACYL